MPFLTTACTAFEGSRCLASGPLSEVGPAAKHAIDQHAPDNSPAVLIFDDVTGEVIELDWRGSSAVFKARLLQLGEGEGDASFLAADRGTAQETPRGPGRPRLGVVAREVTLLPRHWEWLGRQTGGASVALRRLVEAARKSSEAEDRTRAQRASAYRFMVTIAGHQPGFEEASRALFAGDHATLAERIRDWPGDVQSHLMKMLADGDLADVRHAD